MLQIQMDSPLSRSFVQNVNNLLPKSHFPVDKDSTTVLDQFLCRAGMIMRTLISTDLSLRIAKINRCKSEMQRIKLIMAPVNINLKCLELPFYIKLQQQADDETIAGTCPFGNGNVCT